MTRVKSKTTYMASLSCLWPSIFGLLLACLPARDLQAQESPEVTTQEAGPTFKLQSQRNLVEVRVVVRDTKTGKTIGNLAKKDFQLFDNGKPQAISVFSVEKLKPAGGPPEKGKAPQDTEETATPAAVLPQRFLALYFDDIDFQFGDLAQARDAAGRYLKSAMQPGDRAGIYTTSGQGITDFTDSRDKLDEGLAHLRPRPIVTAECSINISISPYTAYAISEQKDPTALDIVTQEVLATVNQGPAPTPAQRAQQLRTAQLMAQDCSRQVLEKSEMQSRQVLRTLLELVRRMGATPGERNIVFVSSGFFSETLMYELNEVIERALRLNVTVNGLDARGLAVFIPGGDASQQSTVPSQVAARAMQYDTTNFQNLSDAMGAIASGTGGIFFHNNNDLDLGFREAGTLPEVSYILAFTPQELKSDGSFHKIKVSLTQKAPLVLQARRGYFAPKKATDPIQQAEDDIKEAVFSQQEMQEIPIQLRTQFFKPEGQNAKLSVLTHVDLKSVHFQKEAGRNIDSVTIVTVLFDNSGNYVTAQRKIVHLRLLDATVPKVAKSGINIKTSLDVKPGTYNIREVVRDMQGQISATNNVIEIPF
jgi:VWFA-related protein